MADDLGNEKSQLCSDIYASFVESSEDAIVFGTLDGRIASWNLGARELLGYESEEAIGQPLLMLIPADEQERFHKVQQSLAQGMAAPRFEARAVKKDGTEIDISIAISSVKDDQGRVVCTGGMFRDITRRKSTEAALARNEALFRFMFSNSPLPMWIFNQETLKVLEVNDAAASLYEYSREEFLASRIVDHLFHEDQPRLRETLARLQGPFSAVGIWRHRTKSGKEIFVEIYRHTVDWNGSPAQHVLAVDITQKRKAEEELRVAHEHSAREARDAAKITELIDILQSCNSVEEAYRVTASALPAVLTSPAGALCITSSSRNLVEAVSVWGDACSTERVFAPPDCWALRRGKQHGTSSPGSPMWCAHVTGHPEYGYVCIPLAAQGESIGLLYAELPEELASGRTSQGAIEVFGLKAKAVAERISLALANLHLREKLRNQSIRDSLTGLFNRRFLEESLERECHRAIRSKRNIALLMFDIDHFKRFNDTFGHQAGDMLLSLLGRVLNEKTRGQDIACRYGGEEFALLLVDTTIDGSVKRAEMLRQELKDLTVQYGGRILGKITVSVGIAAFPDHAASVEEIIRAADLALYRAKSEGRDRVVVAEHASSES